MTVQDLIELLQEYNPDARVVLAYQSHYPLEHELRGLTTRHELVEADADDDADSHEDDDLDDVILVDGEFLGYGSRAAWKLGLRR
jgi:hypothetical protein